MEIFHSFEEARTSEYTAITVGKFDGLHLGHKKLESIIVTSGYKPVLVTFDRSPLLLMSPETGPYAIVTEDERYLVLEDDGIDTVLELPFDRSIMSLSPTAFIERLVQDLNMKLFACGTDFRFGYKNAGDIELLGRLADRYGFELVVIDKIKNDSRDISSSRIRTELKAGNIAKVNQLLGYNYFVYSEVVHGRALGHRLGFPTINQIPEEDKLLPKFGVYATRVIIDDRACTGVTNVGIKPTVTDDRSAGVETYIIDLDEDLYGRTIKIEFIEFIRPEMKFSDTEELKKQIISDKKRAIELLKEI